MTTANYYSKAVVNNRDRLILRKLSLLSSRFTISRSLLSEAACRYVDTAKDHFQAPIYLNLSNKQNSSLCQNQYILDGGAGDHHSIPTITIIIIYYYYYYYCS